MNNPRRDIGIQKIADGDLLEAEKLLSYCLKENDKDFIALHSLGHLKLIKGNINDASILFIKALEVNPLYVRSLYALTQVGYKNHKDFIKKNIELFESYRQKSNTDKIDFLFIKHYIAHKEKRFKESSIFLAKANELKSLIEEPNSENYINQGNLAYSDFKKEYLTSNKNIEKVKNIFIVGIPRSGTTLTESILCTNQNIYSAGESDLLAKAFNFIKENKISTNKLEEYYDKSKIIRGNLYKIYLDKMPYNYILTGHICKFFSNTKIILCSRHPLANILSLLRAHFKKGNTYATCIKSSARLIIHHKKLMNKYKKLYPNLIYEINYEKLVESKEKTILDLINWLGLEWKEIYLHHENQNREINTASIIQARSPINKNSLEIWKEYADLLQPAKSLLEESGLFNDFPME